MRGSKPGERRGGRRKGTPNKRTVEREREMTAVAGKIEAALGEAFSGDAHALLMAVYKDPEQSMKMRIEAAGKAIQYEKPSLSAIDVTSLNEHVVYRVGAEPMSDQEWEAEFATSH